jgi:hypothetical protein
MKNFGRASVHEFLGDRIVYRNLVPIDSGLPPLAEVRSGIGLPEDLVPRKAAPEYARVIVHLLRKARAMDLPGATIKRLIYVGDTPMNDGTAFTNICHAGDWPGLAFIGADRNEPASVELLERDKGTLYVANRWQALAGFAQFCRDRSFPVDEGTAVIVDLDKTAVGARGRNDHVIDRARVEAVRRTVGDLLGDDFDPESFQTSYNLLNQLEFHPFTADNQDYLAYICLILGSGLYLLDSLVANVRAGRVASFQQFIAEVDDRAGELPASLLQIHRDIHDRVLQGDPTPFKAFRYTEYRATVERMGSLPEGTAVESLLEQEIVITQEVREAALAWLGQGALLFGLSDKPDEASIPGRDLAALGYQPIHRVATDAVGTTAMAQEA